MRRSQTGTHRCECNPDANGQPTAHYPFTCQGKVNSGKMTLKEHNDLCKCKKEYLIISADEKARLESVWESSGQSWGWKLNHEDYSYYPVFLK